MNRSSEKPFSGIRFSPSQMNSAGLPVTGDSPVTSMQRRMFRLHQDNPEADILARAFCLDGPLDEDLFRRAVHQGFGRRQVYRDNYHLAEDGVIRRAGDFVPTATFVDCESLSETEWEAVLRTEASRPFDLKTDPLLRVLIFRRSPNLHIALAHLHHIGADGPTYMNGMLTIAKSYGAMAAGQDLPVDVAPDDLADFARFEGDHLATAAGRRSQAYWQSIIGQCRKFEIAETSTVRSLKCGICESAIEGAAYRALARRNESGDSAIFPLAAAAFMRTLEKFQPHSYLTTSLSLRLRRRDRLTMGPLFVNALLTPGPGRESVDAGAKRLTTELQRGQRHAMAADTIGPHGEAGYLPNPAHSALIVFHTVKSGQEGSADFAFGGGGGATIPIGEDIVAGTFNLPWRKTPYGLFLSLAGHADGLHAKLVFNQTLYSNPDAARILEFWREQLV
jgi:Condensation domain